MGQPCGDLACDHCCHVSYSLDRDVVIFGRGQLLFIFPVSEKVQYGALCRAVSGNKFCALGRQFFEDMSDRVGNTACAYGAGGICFFQTALYGKEIRADDAFGAAGISEQHGGVGILYFDL